MTAKDWREWLGEIDEKRRDASNDPDIEGSLVTQGVWAEQHAGDLIEGFRLLAEAVEAQVVVFESRPDKTPLHQAVKAIDTSRIKHEHAIEWLRDVGRD